MSKWSTPPQITRMLNVRAPRRSPSPARRFRCAITAIPMNADTMSSQSNTSAAADLPVLKAP
jgi:hypothetical protein